MSRKLFKEERGPRDHVEALRSVVKLEREKVKMLQADIKNLKEVIGKLNATVENHTWKINSLYTHQTDIEDDISLHGSNQDLQVPCTSKKTQDASTSTKFTFEDRGTSISPSSRKRLREAARSSSESSSDSNSDSDSDSSSPSPFRK